MSVNVPFAADEVSLREASVEGKLSIEARKGELKEGIGRLVESGWPRDAAETYCLLHSCVPALARALRQGDTCYAASTHAIVDVIVGARRRQQLRQQLKAPVPRPSPHPSPSPPLLSPALLCC